MFSCKIINTNFLRNLSCQYVISTHLNVRHTRHSSSHFNVYHYLHTTNKINAKTSQNLVSLVLKLFTQHDDRVTVYKKKTLNMLPIMAEYTFPLSLEYSLWHYFCKRPLNYLSLNLF
jgi:hypothetical protein